jgi:hypothetical protein
LTPTKNDTPKFKAVTDSQEEKDAIPDTASILTDAEVAALPDELQKYAKWVD